MSIEIVNTTDWLRMIGVTGLTTSEFGVFAYVNLQTDDNAKDPVILLSDDASNQWGLYTKTDGVTVRLTDAYANTNMSADMSALSVGTYAFVGITGNGGSVRAYYNGTKCADITRTSFTISSIWWGTDAGVRLQARFGRLLVTRFCPTDDQVAAIRASSTPWSLFDTTTVAGGGTCVGVDISACLGTLFKDANVFYIGMSNTLGTRSSSDPTFGPTASGSCVLPIA